MPRNTQSPLEKRLLKKKPILAPQSTTSTANGYGQRSTMAKKQRSSVGALQQDEEVGGMKDPPSGGGAAGKVAGKNDGKKEKKSENISISKAASQDITHLNASEYERYLGVKVRPDGWKSPPGGFCRENGKQA